MKGISAVIAVVLILMITVALSAAAYVWFSGVFDTITKGAGEAAEGTADTISSSFSIASTTMTGPSAGSIGPKTLIVYLTNTGSTNIDLTLVNVFVEGKLGVNQETVGTGSAWTSIVGNTTSLKIANESSKGDINGKMECGNTVEVAYKSLKQTASIVC